MSLVSFDKFNEYLLNKKTINFFKKNLADPKCLNDSIHNYFFYSEASIVSRLNIKILQHDITTNTKLWFALF